MDPFEISEIPCLAKDWAYLFVELFLKISEMQNFAFLIPLVCREVERAANRGHTISLNF
jgi:hypothetical protein